MVEQEIKLLQFFHESNWHLSPFSTQLRVWSSFSGSSPTWLFCRIHLCGGEIGDKWLKCTEFRWLRVGSSIHRWSCTHARQKMCSCGTFTRDFGAAHTGWMIFSLPSTTAKPSLQPFIPQVCDTHFGDWRDLYGLASSHSFSMSLLLLLVTSLMRSIEARQSSCSQKVMKPRMF